MTQQFTAAPKVVRPKKKYKQPEPQQNEQEQIKLIYNNLMWDKRVFRGNTHAALVTLKNVDTQQPTQTNTKIQLQPQQPIQIQQPSNKRANIQIFTDQFVQTLTDKPPRYQYGSQTDALPQKPVLRHRIDVKSNITDVQTQIWDNQLFDFDYQVEPLLNVLCGRVLEVSRMQVLQQEQLNVMRQRQQQLLLQQKAQREKIRKMYQEQNRLQMENAKKIQKFRKQKDKQIKTHKRLFSRVLAKNFLKNLHQNAIGIVQSNGYLRNPLDIKILNQVPSLFYNDTAHINQERSQLISQAYKIAESVRSQILKQHAWAKQVERTRRSQIVFKRQELAKQKQQRKRMKNEEKEMKEFLQKEKIEKEREEQQRRKAEEAQAEGEGQPQQ